MNDEDVRNRFVAYPRQVVVHQNKLYEEVGNSGKMQGSVAIYGRA